MTPGAQPRPLPRMVAAFCAGDGKKPYATRGQAYYAIAKALVVAKYPAWINDERSGFPDPTWTAALIERRIQKLQHLFFSWEMFGTRRLPVNFDTERWKAVVRRVARFLAFVDARRACERSLDTDYLEAQYQYAEQTSMKFAELAQRCLIEIARRGDSR